ncbi:Mobile element protein [Pseudomonas chlororaphis subsp. piscium]|nr:Mobile element protein [Pseudomonas chlororaphis subsp. piscium]
MPQLALFNEPESEPMLVVEGAEDEEVVAPTKQAQATVGGLAAYRSHP